MAKTILLADLPPQLRDILEEALRRRPDVAVVRGDAKEGLISALTAGTADAVVVMRRDPLASEASAPARITNLSILAIAPDGQSASIHRIRAETQVLNDVTPQGVADALMGSIEAPPKPLKDRE